MKKLFVVSFFFFSFSFFTPQYCGAQTPSWEIGLRFNAVSQGNSVVQTKDKGYVVGGIGQDIIRGIWETYIAKLDSAGKMQWVTNLNQTCKSIHLTNDGGYVVVGSTSAGELVGGYDVYVNKLDSSGNIQWGETIGGIRDDIGYSIIPTNDGGYVITGSTSSFFINDTDVYVIKLNAAGNLQWSKTIGSSSSGYSAGYGIVQTKDKGYAITGATTSFGAGKKDVYVVKLDSIGNLQWTKTIGGSKNDWGNIIIQDRDGGYAITGVTFSYADTVNGDVYIIKLDSAGTMQWTKTIGGTKSDAGLFITQYNNGDYGITGNTNSYDSGTTAPYYIELDSLGGVIQTRTFSVPTGTTILNTIQFMNISFAAIGDISVSSWPEYYVMTFDSTGNNCSNVSSGGIIDSGGTLGSGGIMTTSDSGRVENTGLVYLQPFPKWEAYFCGNQNGGLAVIPNVGNSLCKNYPDGSITLTVVGGFSPYTYSWYSNVSSSYMATGLVAGTYTITVKDSLNDSLTTVVPLYYSSGVYINCYVANQTCNGENNGSITIASISGTPPFTYAWSNGGTSSSDSTLSAGTYMISVTDSCGSSFTDTFHVSLVTDIRDSIIGVTNVSCLNDSNGIATIGVKGSSSPFTYLWSDVNHQTTATASGLKAGTYYVTVTDNCGGASTDSAIITQPGPWTVTASVINNVTCYGGNNGSTISNLNVPIVATYSYEPVVQHFQVPSSVTSITISIAGAQGGGGELGGVGASFTGTIPVIAGDVLSIAVGQQGGFNGGGGASWVYDSNVVLYNPIGTLGLIAVAGGGGGAGSTYGHYHGAGYFGGPGGTNLVTNATIAGTYLTAASGTGGNGGDASGYSAGGAGWLSNGQNSSHYDTGGKDESNHFLSVTNGAGGFGGGGGWRWGCMSGNCEGGGGGGGGYNGGGGGLGGCGGGSYFVNTLPIVSDNQDGNGFVRISYVITGYDTAYKYLWSNGETTSNATGLSAGTYTLTVTNKNGCSATATVTITQPLQLNVSANTTSNVNCNGGNTGSASSNVSGGVVPYTYTWSDSQTTQNISSLSAGIYTLNITDSGGCTATAPVTITQPNPIVIVADSVADNGPCNGAAWVSVSGGTPGYNYLWTGGNTTDSISSQCHGYYCCTITDANGCKDSDCINIVLYTGINEVKSKSGKVEVYPNPSTGLFIVTLGHPELVSGSQTIVAYNVLGEKVFSSNYSLSANHYSLDLINQPNGIYFYRILKEDGGVLGEGKLIIQK